MQHHFDAPEVRANSRAVKPRFLRQQIGGYTCDGLVMIEPWSSDGISDGVWDTYLMGFAPTL